MSGDLLWVNLETTGRNPRQDVILEVAVLLTDGQLAPIGNGIEWRMPHNIRQAQQGNHHFRSRDHDGTAKWLPFSQEAEEIHLKSGLWMDLAKVPFSEEKWVQDKVKSVIDAIPKGDKPSLAGASLGFTRRMIDNSAWLRSLLLCVSDQDVDVATVAELAKRWAPDVHASAPQKKTHRARPDLLHSIDALRHYALGMWDAK